MPFVESVGQNGRCIIEIPEEPAEKPVEKVEPQPVEKIEVEPAKTEEAPAVKKTRKRASKQ